MVLRGRGGGGWTLSEGTQGWTNKQIPPATKASILVRVLLPLNIGMGSILDMRRGSVTAQRLLSQSQQQRMYVFPSSVPLPSPHRLREVCLKQEDQAAALG